MFCTFQGIAERYRENSLVKDKNKLYCGKTGADNYLPQISVTLIPFDVSNVLASHSGPDLGIGALQNLCPDFTFSWEKPASYACGKSLSLYDLTPSGKPAGEPIADCFVTMAFKQGAILAVADGVNWGEPPKRAARCAVLGAVRHLYQTLEKLDENAPLDSNMMFSHMFESLNAAQKLIIQCMGTLTTIVLSVICKCKYVKGPQNWAVMTIAVGDSPAYICRKKHFVVDEMTYGTHAGTMRDPRWCPGALGHAQGNEPDLTNMSCSLTFASEGDMIFLVSDGVSDNFDPVILKHAQFAGTGQHASQKCSGSTSPETELPSLTPEQVQAHSLRLLSKVISDHASQNSGVVTAKALSDWLTDYVYESTKAYRAFIEQHALDKSKPEAEQKERSLSTASIYGGGLKGTMAALKIPGKVDHATIAAYVIGNC